MNRVAEADNVDHAPAAGIIAAAGSSKRMGIPKALLPLNGMSMIERLVKSMIEAGADPIIVVTGHAAEQVRRELEGAIHGAGFVLLMGLMVLLTSKDIMQIFVN